MSRRTEALGEDIPHSGCLEDLPHRSPGDYAGTRRSWFEQHPGGAVTANDLVDDGGPCHWHVEHLATGDVDGLLNRRRNLFGLAVAEADLAFVVAHCHEGREGEPASTLHHLGHAVDVNDALVELGAIAPAVLLVTSTGQNLTPASRTASASAFTRPWNG